MVAHHDYEEGLGACDNASGPAVMLGVAEHFSKNRISDGLVFASLLQKAKKRKRQVDRKDSHRN